jgi:hypothetical protein
MQRLITAYTALFMLSLMGFSFAAQRTVTVSGVVVDSVTGQPVPNAIVLLLDTNITDITQIDSVDINTLKPDTAFTSTDGSFSKTITTAATNLILAYMIVKEGYAIYLTGTIMLSTTINLGTIKLVPTALAPKDTVMVSGKVVDSKTGQGIPDAKVAISGADMDTTGKTVTTDANGTFSRQVILTRITSLTIVGYVAYKEGYEPVIGTKPAPGKTVDLGTIVLSSNAPVLCNPKKRMHPQNGLTTMTLYSLNGKRLYSGRVVPPGRGITHSTSAVLVEFKADGSIVDLKRFVPAR